MGGWTAQSIEDEEGATIFDRRLLERTAEGDGEAFGILVERHQGRLIRLCERLLNDREEARDAAQEVFLKAYRKAGTYSPQGQVFTWIYRIAVNHCLNCLRRRKLVRFLRLEGTEDDSQPQLDLEDVAPGPEERLDQRRRWAATRRAISALPANQRIVLALAKFEGLAYKEIAEVLGITVGAVESRLFRAVRNLEAQETGRSRVSMERKQ